MKHETTAKTAAAGDAKATRKAAPRVAAPHKLDLYRLAVQQPWIQVNWLVNAFAAHYPGRWARHLREDFAGASALAMAWVAHDHDHTAAAIDNHGPTIRFAIKRAKKLAKLNELDPARITFHHADVMDKQPTTQSAKPPHASQSSQPAKADLLVAMNFSVNIYHDFGQLVAYLKNARENLNPQGLFAMDVYGGPGAWRTSTQRRRIRPPRHENILAFDYFWEQQDVDPLSGIVECAIHFKTKNQGRINNAFVYHWRLWTIPELLLALEQAGFGRTQVWCEPPAEGHIDSQDATHGMIEPVDRIGPREDFLAYITAEKLPV